MAGIVAPFRAMTKTRNWECIEDVDFDWRRFTPEIFQLLKPGESPIHGREVRERAKACGAFLGQQHAKYLLRYQELIPREFQGKSLAGKHLVFPGTIYLTSRGFPCMPTLWLPTDGNQLKEGWGMPRSRYPWEASYHWLERSWWDSFLLVGIHR